MSCNNVSSMDCMVTTSLWRSRLWTGCDNIGMIRCMLFTSIYNCKCNMNFDINLLLLLFCF
uniref:Uncharacterized protein n=1 Tax=Oryza brachyantha TaxID=4533 RepID=J3KY84_ORYBR